MDNFYIIATIVFLAIIVWPLLSSRNNSYRCKKCGFTTTSTLEATDHEKLENTHKVVEET